MDFYPQKKTINKEYPLYMRYVLYQKYRTQTIYKGVNMNGDLDDLIWACGITFIKLLIK